MTTADKALSAEPTPDEIATSLRVLAGNVETGLVTVTRFALFGGQGTVTFDLVVSGYVMPVKALEGGKS